MYSVAFFFISMFIVLLFSALTLWAYGMRPFDSANLGGYFSSFPKWTIKPIKIFGPAIILYKLYEIYKYI